MNHYRKSKPRKKVQKMMLRPLINSQPVKDRKSVKIKSKRSRMNKVKKSILLKSRNKFPAINLKILKAKLSKKIKKNQKKTVLTKKLHLWKLWACLLALHE